MINDIPGAILERDTYRRLDAIGRRLRGKRQPSKRYQYRDQEPLPLELPQARQSSPGGPA